MQGMGKSHTNTVRKGGVILRTYSLLKGLPVFTVTGKRIGNVHDLSLSEAGRVTGLVLQRQAIFHRDFHLALDDVLSFGKDGIVIQQQPPLQQVPDGTIWLEKDDIIGKLLLSNSGDELGFLSDVYFMEKMGTIVAYETTDGFFSETAKIESRQPPAFGKDAIIVSVYVQ